MKMQYCRIQTSGVPRVTCFAVILLATAGWLTADAAERLEKDGRKRPANRLPCCKSAR